MSRTAIYITILFVASLLAQVLICNHIVLFSVAVPIVFIFFIIRTPLQMSQPLLLTLSFLLGLLVDIFADTPGVNALCSVVLAMIKRPLFFVFVLHDDHMDDAVPSIPAMGILDYGKFLMSMVVAYCTMVFTIEFFSFARFGDILLAVVSSSLLSFLLMLGADSLMIPKREKGL